MRKTSSDPGTVAYGDGMVGGDAACSVLTELVVRGFDSAYDECVDRGVYDSEYGDWSVHIGTTINVQRGGSTMRAD